MAELNGTTIDGGHQYLADHRPDWTGSMATIRQQGGPWPCHCCSNASLLVYRCSDCGAELNTD